MNVLREVFYGIKQKRNYEAAAHLRRHGGRRCAGSMIWKRRYKQSAWPHNDGAFISLQRLFVNRSHLRIAGDDVTGTVIGRQLDENAAVLRHRQPDDGFVFRDINLRIAYIEIWCRLSRLGRRGARDHTFRKSLTATSTLDDRLRWGRRRRRLLSNETYG